ncbi:polycystic kidney disease and receptor for egg jelly-related protein [Molossus molossus]|uniref:polycystic kidney disease and receptor for egg jelly-related protein n=1 Tax=Molossus molossus TaxID=27622 RepID=UPI00174653A3|nr:polycystic kidney disease and receptor for egg jelly-related protein [Molossus molossus]
MRPAPALLLLLGLGWGCGHRPPPQAPRGAPAVSALVPGAPAAAHDSKAGPRVPAQGEVTTPRSVGGAQGLGLPGGHTHLSLRPRRALRGGVLSDGSLRLCCFRGPARWPRWRRAPRSAPAHADSHLSAPGGQPSRQGLTHPRRSLWPGSRRDAPSASSGLPRSTPPGGPHPSAGFVTPTQCPTDALRSVVSEAVNSDGSPAPDSSVSCPLLRQGTCVIKKLKVNSYIGRPPLLLTRDKNISLYATLSYDCPSLQSKHTDWSVFSTPSLIKEPDWTKPLVIPTLQVGNDPTIVHVLKNTLFLGVYVFRFSVSLVTASGLVVEGSDHAYVSIVSNFLRAVILGDADIKINFTDGLVLNGSTSSDPDVDNPLEGLLFSWYCTTNPKNYNRNKINVISKDVCLPEQGDLEWTWASGPVLTVLPETLKGDQVYFFRMVIKKHHRTAFAAKRVQVLQGPTPAAHISCIENCDAVLVISDRFSLCLICTNCLTSRDVYKWSILLPSGGEIGFDWTGQTSTGRNSSYLSIKAFAFKNFFEAKFWVSLDLAAWSGVTTVLRYPFIINYAPEIGECNINPTNGTAFFTKFIVQCSNFKDQNVPLTYKIIVSDLYGFAEISSLKENTLGPILYMGNKPTSPPSFLPVSMLDRQLATKIFVQVYDSLGAFAQVTLHAMVQAPTDRDSPESVLQRLLNFTTGQSSEMATLLQKQEFLPAGYLTYVAASVLNSVKAEPGLQEDRARLQEHLVNQSVVLPMNSLEEVSQVVTAITKLTQDTSAFRPVSRKLVTGRIWQANQALQQHQQNDANSRSEQIEIVSTGILTSVSNILKMSTHHQIVDDPFYVIQSLAETILTSKVPGNETTVTTTSSFNMYIRKVERTVATNVLGDEKHSRNRFHPTLNTSRVPGLSADAQISMVFCEFADDPFPWLNDQESPGTDVVGFRVTGVQATGQVLEITPDVADVYLARKNLSSAAFKLTVGPDNEPDKVEVLRQTTGAFRFEVDSREVRELLVHVVTEVTVLFTVLVYAGSQIALAALVATFLVPQDIPPVAHQNGLFDAACPVKMARVLCLPPSLLRVIAQRGGSSECTIVMVLQAPHFVMQPSDKLVRIALFSVRCLDMYGIQRDWIEDTCVLGETTTWDRVHCVCKNARRARRQLDAIRLANIRLRIRYLTAKVIVPPNPVDLRLEVIKKVAQNPVTVSTVFFIMASYIVLAFWALHRDETDQFVWDHVIVLPDNDPYDDVCYLITVFTGSRCGSGTRANVFVQLRGTSSSSDVHCLSHPNFKTLYRASIHTFLLTTKSDLGDIRSIRVWHNNEGRAPSWYLSRVKVENLFTRHIWLFMCREWLSVDTSLDRTFHVTDPNQPLQTGDFFLIDVTDKLGKNHMWFSVFASATTQGFTRVQRLSCCLAMLLSSLMCNIMFFNLNTEEEDSDQGSRYIRSMVIGLESVVITIPVQVMITFLFTYSQRRPRVTLEEVSPRQPPAVEAGRHWEERLEKWHAQEITKALSKEADKPTDPGFLKSPVKKTSKASRRHKKAKSKDSGTHRTDTDTDTDTDTNVNTNANTNTNANDKTENASPEGPSAEPPPPADPPPFTEKPRITLPSCCVYLAWFLVFATSGVSSFFIVFYGLTYGYERSIEWLFASFCSFCQSIFLVQPSKIIILSSIRSNRPKYCKNLPWVSNYRYSEIRLQDLRLHPEEMRMRHMQVAHLRSTSMYQPLTRDEIRIFKRRKKVKRRAWLFLSYGLTHFVFLALLLSLSALLQHTDSFRYNQFIRGQFSVDLAAVTTLDDIYRWLDSVLPPLFHNDRTPTFLPDSSSKILGLPLMRQVRAKLSRKVCLSASRVPPNSIEGEIHCHPKYGTDLEDTDNYSGSWKKVGKQVADKNTKGFTYKPPEKRWVYHSYGLLHTYGSGGYAFYFFPDQQRFNSTVRLKDLQSSGWLDEKTWAVILDLTTFNPDASLLCSVSVLFEVSQLGVVNTSISVHSFSLADLDRKTSAEVYLYAAVLVFFLAYAAHDVYIITQERASYVTSVHNVLNFALKCLFVVLIALFFRKYILATGITHLYASNPVDFIPFHAVSQVDHAMRVTLGFLLFLTILKTLGYFRFFYEVRLAQRAIWIALPGICHVALLVSLCLFVYVAFGHLVFGQHEWNYSNFIDATQTVFSYCVSAFRNTDFSNNRVLGVLFLSSFVLLLICVLISLFKAVILPAYEDMRQPVYEEPSEEVEAIAYLCGKLRALLGVLCFRPKAPKEPVLFADMLYGKPEAHSRRYLGLKTRRINERKMVYLVV